MALNEAVAPLARISALKGADIERLEPYAQGVEIVLTGGDVILLDALALRILMTAGGLMTIYADPGEAIARTLDWLKRHPGYQPGKESGA